MKTKMVWAGGFILITGTLIVLLLSPGSALANLLTNGDFESGNTGFSSSYAYTTGSLGAANTYTIGIDPNDHHSSWTSFGDHTSNTGKMMIANGGSSSSTIFWSQNKTFEVGRTYDFSGWIASCYSTNPAQLALKIDDSPIATFTKAPNTTATWQAFSVSFVSDFSGTHTLKLFDLTTASSGNDFAIDDLSLTVRPVPIPPTIWLLGAGLAGLVGLRRRFFRK